MTHDAPHPAAPSTAFHAPTALLEKVQSRSPYPLVAMIVLTRRCNLSCPHCYEQPGVGDDELTTREWLDVLAALEETGTLMLIVSGGEPLVRPDFFEIVEAAGRRRFAITLKSNGTRLTAETAARCFHAGISKLDVSLYHDHPRQHDAFVGKSGAFARSIEGLRAFRALGGQARANIVVMNWNADSVSRLIDRCEQEGWRFGVDTRITVTAEGDRTPKRFRATREQLESVLLDPRLYNAVTEADTAASPPDAPLCGAGTKSVTIRPSGEVWPCNLLPISLGNLRRATYRDILESAGARGTIPRPTWGDSKPCARCEVSFACMRCPGNAYLEHGDPAAPSEVDCMLAELHAGMARRRGGRSR